MGTHWLIEDVEALRAALLAHPLLTTREVYDYLPEATRARHTLDQCNNKASHLGLGSKVARMHEAMRQDTAPAPAVVALPTQGRPSYWRSMETISEEWQEENLPAGMYTVDLRHEAAPVLIVFTSDWHVGAKATRYSQLRADITAIASAEGAYPILAGDLWHNHKRQRKSGTALYETIASPDEQPEWTHDIAAPIMGKTKGVVEGNHEMFDTDEAGRHLLREWCATHGLPYWSHGGAVCVMVGPQRYYGAVRHQYPGASSINTSNNGRRVAEGMGRPREAAHLDFIYLGHLHYNDQHVMPRPTGECHYLRGGSYLGYNEWAHEKLGAGRTESGCPSVLLYADTRDAISFKGNRLDLALDVLARERAKHRATNSRKGTV